MYILTKKARITVHKQIRDRYYIFDSSDGSCIHISVEALETLIKKGIVIEGIKTNNSTKFDDWYLHPEKVVVDAEDIIDFAQTGEPLLACKLYTGDITWNFVNNDASFLTGYKGKVHNRHCVYYEKFNMDIYITDEQVQRMRANNS